MRNFRTWFDVKPSDWFYNDVIEASNYFLENGDPLVRGIPYDTFEGGKERIYHEVISDGATNTITLPVKIEPSEDNPLYFFIDGVSAVYIDIDNTGSHTKVVLFTTPYKGAILSFLMLGKIRYLPDISGHSYVKNKPMRSTYSTHPRKKLDHGDTYVFHSRNKDNREFLRAFGTPIKRVQITEQEWMAANTESKVNQMLDKYIGYDPDLYTVSPSNHPVYPGYIFLSHNLHGKTLNFRYFSNQGSWSKYVGGDFKAFSDPKPVYIDMFFPHTIVQRKEAAAFLIRLIDSFVRRYTDSSIFKLVFNETFKARHCQQEFHLQGFYNPGRNELTVTVDGKIKTPRNDYDEINETTIRFKEQLPLGANVRISLNGVIRSGRFSDIPSYDPNNPDELARQLLVFERLKLNDGTYITNGDRAGSSLEFGIDRYVTRGQMAVLIDRVMLWCVERFRL